MKRIKKGVLFVLFAIFFAQSIYAQSTNTQDDGTLNAEAFNAKALDANSFNAKALDAKAHNANANSANAFLIPRHIYIGDPATLVLPLPEIQQNSPDIIITAGSEFLPSDPDIDFHKIILERHVTGSRLLIEFTPFITGIIEFPVIEIGELYFTDLTVSVNSIIEEKSSPVLSGPASTLAIPGTSLILYGSLVSIVFILLITFWFIFKGRAFIKLILEKWKRYRRFSMMRKTEKRLHKEILKGTDKRLILDTISDEFRTFLSYLSGCNCRAMTANEFENLPRLSLTNNGAQSEVKMNIPVMEGRPSFLTKFFRTCDDLRFSGINVNPASLIQMLDDMRSFLDLLESEKEIKQKEKAA